MSFARYEDLIVWMEFMVELSDGLSVYQNLLVAEKRLDIIAALLLEVQKQELHEGGRSSDFEGNILVHFFTVQGLRFKGQWLKIIQEQVIGNL